MRTCQCNLVLTDCEEESTCWIRRGPCKKPGRFHSSAGDEYPRGGAIIRDRKFGLDARIIIWVANSSQKGAGAHPPVTETHLRNPAIPMLTSLVMGWAGPQGSLGNAWVQACLALLRTRLARVREARKSNFSASCLVLYHTRRDGAAQTARTLCLPSILLKFLTYPLQVGCVPALQINPI